MPSFKLLFDPGCALLPVNCQLHSLPGLPLTLLTMALGAARPGEGVRVAPFCTDSRFSGLEMRMGRALPPPVR